MRIEKYSHREDHCFSLDVKSNRNDKDHSYFHFCYRAICRHLEIFIEIKTIDNFKENSQVVLKF